MTSLNETSPSTDQTPSFNIELVNNTDENDEDETSNSFDELANDEEMRVCSMEKFESKMLLFVFLSLASLCQKE